MVRLTPAMQQYMEIKNQHPDTVVLFRMGDFYETFFEDAKTASRELNITLTSRGKGETKTPLAGIPYHALDQYLGKLVKKNYKVAIVEQVEDPKLAKGLVKRDLIRIVTPGTVMGSDILNAKSNNYILSIVKEGDRFGIAAADLSTGEFVTTEVDSKEALLNEVNKFGASECVIALSQEEVFSDILDGVVVSSYDDRHFWNGPDVIKSHFDVANLESFGLDSELAVNASGALLSYIKDTQKTTLDHISKIKKYSTSEFMVLDKSTVKNLELLSNIRDGSSRGALISVLDCTLTSMGSRLIKKWVLQPLLDVSEINSRLSAVDEVFKDIGLRQELRSELGNVSDIERLISRVTFGSANARDMLGLKNSLMVVPAIGKLISGCNSELLCREFEDVSSVVSLIDSSIKDEPAVVLREGNMIKSGYNADLDKLHEIKSNSKKFIADLEEKERSTTGIKSLKIRFNRVFGYFIEVTKANLHLVPSHYIRKQTQVNAERYITEELKEQEGLILGAEEKINNLEYELFMDIVKTVGSETKKIQKISDQVALLDVVCCFSEVAANNNYVKPIVDDSDSVLLEESRHPVLEQIEDIYVPNDVELGGGSRLHIITGPNMAGKSTVMRQAALIVLMAQIGSFVPASSAKIGVVDRIFTRVGAYDDLTMGQSTFMVEMNETANILNNATSKSLIILDEIGRGTSTYDGISIAWSVAEYLHNNVQAKTMFATHYHQMNKLAEKLDGVKNFNMAVREEGDKIVFLRKVVEGGTDKSLGIQVAKLAGLPGSVIDRSKVIMNRLEMEDEISERIHKDLKGRNGSSQVELSERQKEDIIQKTLNDL